MNIVEDVQSFEGRPPRVVLTIGSFDGVHVGHRAILNTVLRRARADQGAAAVLTLRPHPREFFSPNHAPNLLTSDETKFRLLESLGIDIVFLLPFTAEVANLERSAFVQDILVNRCRVRHLVVGHDFCFGRDAQGDFAFLQAAGAELGFTSEQAAPVIVDGERVSSTLIREHVLAGDLERAETFLGRKYSISGTVISGRGIGSKLGFPTANIKPHHSAIPAQGVYIAEAVVEGTGHAAAINIGIAPTIRNDDLTVEAFLLDFQGELGGQRIELIFHRRIRPERKFPSYEALQAQIQSDVAAVRAYFIETKSANQ